MKSYVYRDTLEHGIIFYLFWTKRTPFLHVPHKFRTKMIHNLSLYSSKMWNALKFIEKETKFVLHNNRTTLYETLLACSFWHPIMSYVCTKACIKQAFSDVFSMDCIWKQDKQTRSLFKRSKCFLITHIAKCRTDLSRS